MVAVLGQGLEGHQMRQDFRSEKLTPRDKGRDRFAVRNVDRTTMGILVIMVDNNLQCLLGDRNKASIRSTGIAQLAPKSIPPRPDPFPLTVKRGRWAGQGVLPLHLAINPETVLQETPLLALPL